MKNALNIAVILSVMVLFGCSKDDSLKPLSFNEKVGVITKNKQFKPALTDFVNIEWTCTDWKLSFYNSVEMVGEWNSYNNTILDKEKSQIYKFDNNQLNVSESRQVNGLLQMITKKASNYTWDNSVLTIFGISYIVKMQDDKLYLYFDTKDIVKVGESFNVTVDNTYGRSLEQEAGVIGVGLIQFTKKEIPQINQPSIDNITLLINKYLNRDDMLNQKFNIIETSSTDHTYILSGGSDNLKHNISLTNHQTDLVTLTPARTDLLFRAFVTKSVFTFKGVDLKINKIEHEDGDPFSFYVFGVTSLTGEAVKFYYHTSNGREEWVIAPSGTNQPSIDNINLLINKFLNRDDMLNQKFNIIETSSTDHTYILSGGSDNLKHNISLTNHQTDLVTLTPARTDLLFRAFVTKSIFTFKGVDLKINKIEHEDGGPFSFYVFGVTSLTGEAVKFYYHTSNGREEWVIAPSGSQLVDINLLVGLWSYDTYEGFSVKDVLKIKKEYKADHIVIIFDGKDNVEKWGTWSVSADKKILTEVFTKKIEMTTRVTTSFSKTDEHEIKSLTNTELILLSDWGVLGKRTSVFSKI